VANDVPYGQVGSGEGPRHLSFHPSGRFVYVINEIGSSLSAFAYDGERGAMTHLQTLATLPEGFSGANSCAQIVVHPNGRFVYGSNRGHDSIAIFAIDQSSGRLAPLGHESTQGKTPRNFNIDPSGTFLFAANQDTDTIVTFRIDTATGALTPAGHVAQTPAPVCIVFRPA
jgi:6-phosphogluconolactonase